MSGLYVDKDNWQSCGYFKPEEAAGQEVVSGHIVGLLALNIKNLIKKTPKEHKGCLTIAVFWPCQGKNSSQDTFLHIKPPKAIGPAFSKTTYQKYSTGGETKLEAAL